MLTIIQNEEHVPAGLYGDWLAGEGVPHRIVRPDHGETLPDPAPGGRLIVLGGYMSVYDVASHPFLGPLEQLLRDWVVSGRPLLGICLGGQLLAKALGGKVSCNHRGERGMLPVEVTAAGQRDSLLAGVGTTFRTMQWHNDSFDLPPEAVHLASSAVCPGQAFRVGPCAYGVQFHPELTAAIVADWSQRKGLDDHWLTQFRTGEDEYRRSSLQLLKNFLELPQE